MLAGNTGYHFQLLNAVIEVNELQKRRVVQKLGGHLGSLVGRGWRCSASPSSRTPTTCARRRAWCCRRGCRAKGRRSSPTTRLRPDAARDLLDGVELRDSALEALTGADAAVLVTEWPEFAELDWAEAASRMARPLLVDGRNFLDPEKLYRRASNTRGSAGRRSMRRRRRPPTESCRRLS